MTEKTKKGLLFTPGPLTTSLEVKKVMLEDWGSRDIVFLETTKRIRDAVEKIGGITGKNPSHTCIPIQGSGTFAVEAAITSLIPKFLSAIKVFLSYVWLGAKKDLIFIFSS